MRVLIDTHIFVWAQLEPARLTGPARDLLDRADTAVAMSALTLYELSVLLERRRVAVNLPPETWIREALARSGVELLPVTEAIAYRARSLPGYPAQDPFDA